MTTAVLPRRGFLPSFSLGKPGQFLKRYGLFSLFLITFSEMSMAGTDTTFSGIYDFVVYWAFGLVGKLLAVIVFVVCMGIARVRQSIRSIVIGIGVTLVMFYGPGIIDGIVTFAI